MTITFEEQYESGAISRGGNNSSGERRYLVKGSASAMDIDALVASNTPAAYGNQVRNTYDLRPVHVDEDTPADCIWELVVRYVDPGSPYQSAASTFSFDTGGGTQHLLASLATVGAFGGGAAVGDNGNLIGVTEDGVEGVDVTVPIYQFSETHFFGDAAITDAYKAKLFALTGRTNNATFRGLAAGECLFLGASGSKRGNGLWEITFKFAGSPNRTNFAIGDITGINKKGWEYLWVRFARGKSATLNRYTQYPVSAYVEKVYEEGDFADLALPE